MSTRVNLSLTLKARNRSLCTKEIYEEYRAWLELFMDTVVHIWAYETDKQERLHVHALINISNAIKYKAFQRPTYSVKVKPLKALVDCERWADYCLKDQDMRTDTNDIPPKKSMFK